MQTGASRNGDPLYRLSLSFLLQTTVKGCLEFTLRAKPSGGPDRTLWRAGSGPRAVCLTLVTDILQIV